MSEFFRALEQAGRDRDERLAKQRNNRKPPVAAEPPAQPEPEVPVVAKAGKPRKESQPAAAPKATPTPAPEVVATAPVSTPRKESRPAAAPTPTPTPEPEVVAVAPTITPRHETRPPVAVEIPAPEPEVATIEAAVATEVEPEPEPEIATDIQHAIYTELHPIFHPEVEIDEVEPEMPVDVESEIYDDVEIHAVIEPEVHEDIEPDIHMDIEPEIPADVEPEVHAVIEPEIHADVEPEIHADVEPEIRMHEEPEIQAEVEDETEAACATEGGRAATPMPFAMRAADAPAFTESVPTVKDDDAESVDDRLVTLLTPNSFAGEQYRTLRHLVEKMHTETGVSVVGVSSPSIGDGKTTTAINLAGALAQARETKVLLIDMDLRRPAVNGQLGLRGFNPKGVVAVLGAGASLDDVIVELPMFNLSIIPSGPRQSAPYELLKSSRLHQMMDEARRRFDYVIVDTPPVIAVPDCRVISSGVDGFLIIVNAHKTPTRLLGETVSVLGQSKVLGLIFNRDDQPIAEHLYNSYGPDPSGGWTGSIRRRLRRNGHGNGNASGNGTGYLSGNGITH
jgi:capsular exopolysaccharide synthesis family protein